MKKLLSTKTVSFLVAGAAVCALLLGVGARPAHAWKPKTHVYLAEQAMKDALDNGKVTIYETDYKTGRIVGVLGEFEVDGKILSALKQAPEQFRAGVLGPDAYPDILTGQQIIHPDEAHAVDGGAGGSNAWLSHIWTRGFESNPSPKVQAFTLGYVTHAAGDVWAHTYVNHFAGGEFLLFPDPTNAVKHLVLEGYIGKRTPTTASAVGKRVATGTPGNGRKRDDLGLDDAPGGGGGVTYTTVYPNITGEDTSIAGVEEFIYTELTYATPGSVLEEKLLKGDATGRSIPHIFSTLRNGLQKDVEEYDRVRLSKKGPDRVAYAASHGPKAEYKRAWIADIDKGLRAFPGVSHELAKALVYNEGGADLGRAKEVMGKYLREHLISMRGVPDGAVITVGFISDVIGAILPQPLKDALDELMREPLNYLAKGASGKTLDEWAGYLKNPENSFDDVLNRPGGGHGGEIAQTITLAAFNRDHLKISDTGYQNPSLKWEINNLPPAFNTLQMNKMMFLSENGMRQLTAALNAKGAKCSVPQPYRNAMLGWVRSLDRGNQWQGFAGQKGDASPKPFFSENEGAAYQKLFLAQIGEKRWAANAPTHGSSPVSPNPPHDASPLPTNPAPPTPAPSPAVGDLKLFEGYWSTTRGTIEMRLGSDGVLRGTFRDVETVELRAGKERGEAVGVWKTPNSLYENNGAALWQLSDDGESFVGYYTMRNAPGEKQKWDGRRVRSGGTTTPTTPSTPEPGTPTNPGTPGLPTLPKTPTTPGDEFRGNGEWKSLTHLDVRLDKIRTGRDGSLEVFGTLKNTQAGAQQVVGGSFLLYMFDADGVGWIGVQNLYRASGDVPTPLSTLNMESGEEIPVRFVFRNPGGWRALSQLRIQDKSKREEQPALFDLHGFLPKGGDGSGGTIAGGLRKIDGGEFKPLDNWDIRIDGLKQRGGEVDVFFTVKNTDNKLVRFSAVRSTLTDVEGVPAMVQGTFHRASGDKRERITEALDVEPGREMRLCLRFKHPNSSVIARRLVFEINGGGRQTWEVNERR